MQAQQTTRKLRNLSPMKRPLMIGGLALLATAVALLLGGGPREVRADVTLSVTPITWDVIGLDSNRPDQGPYRYPVGARVCNTGDTDAASVDVAFSWDSDNDYIDLRPGSLTEITFAPLAAGECQDAYFEVEVETVPTAYDTSREYIISATDGIVSASSPTPRQLYIEHLVSQSRNYTTNMFYGTEVDDLTQVAAGGYMNLMEGGTYYIRLSASTATQGYEQLESFITLSNTVFRILDVTSTYTANSSPYVPSPNDKLYADACRWQADPNSPAYLSCLNSGYKAGGDITTTYHVEIIDGGGTTEKLSSLIYDFSGSSFHYNSDVSASARFANIIDPTNAGFTKAFSPATTGVGGVSRLTFTITNPNAGTVSGYNFTDTLPAGLEVADPAATQTNGCGTPTFAPAPGDTVLAFSDGIVGGGSSCTVSVAVTATGTGSYFNTSDNLFVGDADTGKHAEATLTVNSAPPPPACMPGLSLAAWDFSNTTDGLSPDPSSANVIADTAAGSGLVPVINSDNQVGTSGSWASDFINNSPTLNMANNEYFQFSLDTTGFESVTFDFWAKRTTQGAQNFRLYYGLTGTENASTIYSLPSTAWTDMAATTLTTGLNPSGITVFRLYAYNAGQNNNGHAVYLDGVTFTGCGVPQAPTVTKSFSPNPVATGVVSRLTITLANPNLTALTGVSISDPLPMGMTVAETPNATLTPVTCAGTWAPTTGSGVLTFSGGTLPAKTTCSLAVNVTTTTPGPNTNITGSVSTTQTGVNYSATGSAQSTLTALQPPQIDKQFLDNPVVAGQASTLAFTITNPNQDNPISGIAFGDTLVGLTVATPPGETNSCGGTWMPGAGDTVLSFSGGTLAAGASCTLTVDVITNTVGTYPNSTTAVSHIVNGVSYNGDPSSDTLTVNTAIPGIAILKQVGLSNSPTGDWYSYLAVPEDTQLYYRIVVENTGEIPLSGYTVADPGLDLTGCSWTDPLPVAAPNSNAHITTCFVTGPTADAGEHSNTATASYTAGPNTYTDQSIATYATTGLTLEKTADVPSYNAEGDVITYTFTVTNTGSATLDGPVTIADDLIDSADITCEDLTTIGDGDAFLNPTEAVTCTASYTVTLGDLSLTGITNTASASAGGVTSAPDSVTVMKATVTYQPVATDDSATTNEDTPVTVDVTDNDDFGGDGPSITDITLPDGVNTLKLPDNGTLTLVNGGDSDPTNDEITYTPNADWSGTDTFEYQICDSNGDCDIALVTITVNAVNDLPVATDDSGSTSEDTPVTVDVTDNDDFGGDGPSTTDITLPDGINALKLPDNGTLTLVNGGDSDPTNDEITYTPNADWSGTDTFEYQICDANGDCDIALVTITVNAVNDLPVATDDSATTDEDTPVTVDVTGNDDFGGDGPAVTDIVLPDGVNALKLPDNGTVLLVNGGDSDPTNDEITYTPNADWSGTDTFEYQICDANGDCDIALVTITVNAVNDLPVAVDDNATTNEDTPVTVDVTDNDDFGGDGPSTTDITLPDGVNALKLPDNGTVTLVNGGDGDPTNDEITYTPNAGFIGTDTFEYQICDSDNECDTATVTVTINNVLGFTLVANESSSASPGDTVIYSHTLTNTGGAAQDFTISFPGGDQGWTQTLAIVDSGGTELAVINPGETYDVTGLAAGDTLTLVHTLLVPLGTPDGTVDSSPISAYVTTNPGGTRTVTDTTSVGAGCVEGYLFHDLNQNGAMDSGEPPFANVGISLYDGPDLVLETVTDSTGYYDLSGLPADVYRVVIDETTLPAGIPLYIQPDMPEQEVTVTVGGDCVAGTFGLVLLDPAVTKTTTDGEVLPGELVVFTITAINDSEVTITDVTVTDALDGNLEFLTATTGQGSYGFDGATNTVTFTLGSLPAGATVEMTITTRVRDTAPRPATISNAAVMGYSEGADETSEVVVVQVPDESGVVVTVTPTLDLPDQLPDTGGVVTGGSLLPWLVGLAGLAGAGWAVTRLGRSRRRRW